LAGQFKANLILAHIVPESSALTYAFPTETWKIEKEQHEKADREMSRLVPSEYAARLNIRTIVEIGSIEQELLAVVGAEGVDLVVMGAWAPPYEPVVHWVRHGTYTPESSSSRSYRLAC
jgi:nucleotide-binding universal stress UspA family protein